MRNSRVDRADLNLRVGLTMTLGTTITLLGLHLVNTDLLALAVLDNACGNGSALQNRSTELAAGLVDDGENLVEDDGFTGLNVQLLDKDDVALGNTVLLAAGNDDCILHYSCTCLSFCRLALGA